MPTYVIETSTKTAIEIQEFASGRRAEKCAGLEGRLSIGGSPIGTNITHSGSIVARTPPAMPQAPCASEKVAMTMNRSQECDKPLIRYARNI